jgi:hypothetical protein
MQRKMGIGFGKRRDAEAQKIAEDGGGSPREVRSSRHLSATSASLRALRFPNHGVTDEARTASDFTIRRWRVGEALR